MFDQLFERPSAVEHHLHGPLLETRLRYLKHYAQQGASKSTLRTLAQQMLVIIDYLQLDGSNGEISEAEIEDAANRWINRKHHLSNNMKPSQHAKEVFISVTTNWLRFIGRLHLQQPSIYPYSSMIDGFVNYLSSEKEFSKTTIPGLRGRLREFLSKLYRQNCSLTELTIDEIQDIINSKAKEGWARTTIRGYCYSLRLFFRYAEMRGWCKTGLATAIISPCIFKEENLPAGPSWENVQRLIAGISDDPMGKRDKAILMLCAVYGLRSSEVCKLCIEDIDWEREQIVVRRAKQGETQIFPCAYTVGEAILRYLKEVRPRCSYREIFLTLKAPIKPLSSGGLYHAVSRHLRSLNLQTNRYGPHSLRHACASHLLAEGLSLKEIGDYLGHRSSQATRIYAKVDMMGLREVANFQLGGLL